MGRIKSTLIKRTSRQLIENSTESFGNTFEENKKALGSILPSKKMRNKVAGYIARIKRNTKTIIDDTDTSDATQSTDSREAASKKLLVS
jgi:small subunit ribosomal protein S17e